MTFSCQRELGRSPWSRQQVLSTVFGAERERGGREVREEEGGGGRGHVTRAGCHICASLWPRLSHQLNHWQKGTAAPSLAALICFPQSIFTLAAFFSAASSTVDHSATHKKNTSGARRMLVTQ